MSTHVHASAEDVYSAAIACQLAYHQWAQACDQAEQAVWSTTYHEAAGELLELLRPDLERLARKWYRSMIASDTASLTLNLFTALVLALPHLRLDPEKNTRNFLLTVAHRRTIDFYRQDGETGPRRKQTADDEREHRLMIVHQNAFQDDIWPQDAVDSTSFDAEDTWIRTLDDNACIKAIAAYWHDALNAVDRQIMLLRLKDATFRDIAQQLEKPLEEGTVRQRYRRIIQHMRARLRQIGLLP